MVVVSVVMAVLLLAAAPTGSTAAVTLNSNMDLDNLVVPNGLIAFHNRDFVTVEGFAEHAGEMCTVSVYRRIGTTNDYNLIGQAKSTISGQDVAFEVNHPGGACWAAGVDTSPTGHPELDVTPDFKPGDRIQVTLDSLGDHVISDQFVLSPEVTTVNAAAPLSGGRWQIIIEGRYGNDVKGLDFMEQRTVNPDLVDLIGKRSIRATSVATDAAQARADALDDGLLVYVTSVLEVSASAVNQVTATYTFVPVDASQAAITAAAAAATTAETGGGHRMMSWDRLEGADRVKMTIAEMDEPGGPGMGGCPAGSVTAAPKGTTARLARSADTATLRWAPTVAGVASPPVTDYVLIWQWAGDLTFEGEFVPQCTNEAGDLCQREYTTIAPHRSSLPATVSLRPISTDTDGKKVVGSEYTVADAQVILEGNSGPGSGDVPTVTFGGVAADACQDKDSPCEAASVNALVDFNLPFHVFFTDDGTSPVDVDDVSLTAKPLAGGASIPVTKPVHIQIVAIGDASSRYSLVSGHFKPPPRPALPQQAATVKTEPSGGVTLTWTDIPLTGGDGAGTNFVFVVRRYTLVPTSEPDATEAAKWLESDTTVWAKTTDERIFSSSTRTVTIPISLPTGKKAYYSVFPRHPDGSFGAPGSVIVGDYPGDVITITRIELKKTNLRIRGTINAFRSGGTLQVKRFITATSSETIGVPFGEGANGPITSPDNGVTGTFDVTVTARSSSNGRVYVAAATVYRGNSNLVSPPTGRRLLQD